MSNRGLPSAQPPFKGSQAKPQQGHSSAPLSLWWAAHGIYSPGIPPKEQWRCYPIRPRCDLGIQSPSLAQNLLEEQDSWTLEICLSESAAAPSHRTSLAWVRVLQRPELVVPFPRHISLARSLAGCCCVRSFLLSNNPHSPSPRRTCFSRAWFLYLVFHHPRRYLERFSFPSQQLRLPLLVAVSDRRGWHFEIRDDIRQGDLNHPNRIAT